MTCSQPASTVSRPIELTEELEQGFGLDLLFANNTATAQIEDSSDLAGDNGIATDPFI